MRIREIMSAPVVTLTPSATVAAARMELSLHGFEHLLVALRRKVIGVVSARDLGGQPDDAPLSDVMSREVITIEPDSTLRHAAAVMDGNGIDCLPVMKEGELKGIVTSTDLLRAVAKGATHADAAGGRYALRKRSPRKQPAAGRTHTS